MLTRLLLRVGVFSVTTTALLIVALRLIAPSLPSDGQLAYAATDANLHALYLADVRRRIAAPLIIDGRYRDGLSWSSDGERLGYVQYVTLTGAQHIITMDMTSYQPQVHLTRGYDVVLPDKYWSADLSQVVYGFADVERNFFFTHVDLRSGEVGNVYVTSTLAWGYDIIWAGDEVHYALRKNTLQTGIIPRTSEDLQIEQEWEITYRLSYEPRFSTDASQLILAAVGEGMTNYDLFLYDLELDEPINLTESRSLNEGVPVWSADGKRILYKALNNIGQFIYLRELYSDEPMQLYRNDGNRIDFLRFSPDEHFVSFVENMPNGQQSILCVLRIEDGASPNCIAQHQSIDAVVWRS